jgi:hypothetical protein
MNFKKSGKMLLRVGLVLIVLGLVLPAVGVALPSLEITELPSGFNIRIVDVNTSLGVSGADVYLFEGGGGVEPVANAVAHSVTDNDGYVNFQVTGFYRVGVIKDGYVAGYSVYAPFGIDSDGNLWSETWTCWGAGGASAFYTIHVMSIEPVKPVWNPVNLVTLSGVGLVVVGFVARRKKE